MSNVNYSNDVHGVVLVIQNAIITYSQSKNSVWMIIQSLDVRLAIRIKCQFFKARDNSFVVRFRYFPETL